jgi:hypothetical protein
MKYYHLSGIVLIIFTEIVKYFFANNPSWVEDYYANGIYLVVSYILQKISIFYILPGLFAIPILFFIFIFLVLLSKQKKIVKFCLIMNSLGFLYFLFYFVWGFNYYRLPIDHQWKFKSASFTYKQLVSEYEETTVHLLKIYTILQHLTTLCTTCTRLYTTLHKSIQLAQHFTQLYNTLHTFTTLLQTLYRIQYKTLQIFQKT